MEHLLSQLTLEGAGLIVLAILAVLVLIARLHPFAALAIGLPFLAVPVWLLVALAGSPLHNDRSSYAYIVLFVAGAFGAVCAALGAGFTLAGVARLASGEGRDARSRRVGRIVIAVVTVVFGGAFAWRSGAFEPHVTTLTASRDEHQVRKSVPALWSYRLEWKSRNEARKLALALEGADLLDNVHGDAAVKETSDGPVGVDLVLPFSAAHKASFTLYRDDSEFTAQMLRTLAHRPPAQQVVEPVALWMEEEHGGLSLRGMQCGPATVKAIPALSDAALRSRGIRCYEPDAPLTRVMPGLLGFARAPLHFERDDSRDRTGCLVTTRYRERMVRVHGGTSCQDAETYSALADAIELLARAERDAHDAPDAKTRLARATRGVERCEAAAAHLRTLASARVVVAGGQVQTATERVDAACSPAMRLAAAQLRQDPHAAATLALRVIDARPGPHEVRHLDAILTALAPAGESRELLWAHAWRASGLGLPSGANDPRRGASFDFLASRANRVLAPDDPLLERVALVLPSASDDARGAERTLAMLAEWHERARAQDPAGDAALKALFYLCRQRSYPGPQRALSGECGDQLLAVWQERVRSGGSFGAIPDGEAGLLLAIARMYYSQAYADADFRRAAAKVARVRALAEQSLGERYAPLAAAFTDLEAQLSRRA